MPPVPDAPPPLPCPPSAAPQCLEATITAAYMLGTRAMHVCSGRTVMALAKKASTSVQVGFRWWGTVLSRRTGPRCVCQHCCARRLHLEAAVSNLQRIFRSSMPVAWCACSRSGFGVRSVHILLNAALPLRLCPPPPPPPTHPRAPSCPALPHAHLQWPTRRACSTAPSQPQRHRAP